MGTQNKAGRIGNGEWRSERLSNARTGDLHGVHVTDAAALRCLLCTSPTGACFPVLLILPAHCDFRICGPSSLRPPHNSACFEVRISLEWILTKMVFSLLCVLKVAGPGSNRCWWWATDKLRLGSFWSLASFNHLSVTPGACSGLLDPRLILWLATQDSRQLKEGGHESY